jgi:NRAMP (natural resistance-associated macrophage protein)-like metal ion transporter
VAGAQFGYRMLWLLLVMTFSLVIVQAMAARMGAVTGKGLAALIRERFGIKPAFFAMMALLVSNVATTIAQFAGVAAAMEIFGVSRFFAVPVAMAVIWLLVVRGSYRNVEKVFLVLSAVFIAYIVSGVMAEPDWGAVAAGTFLPSFDASTEFVVLAIALTGTTIAPWMQFFTQSNIVDKGLTLKEWAYVRADVITGAVAAAVIAFFIMVTTGAVLHPAGIEITSAEHAAQALAPIAGDYAQVLFGVGLLAASLLAAAILPLTAAYAICEAFGWEAGIDHTWSEAPMFNGIYTFAIMVGGLVVLVPGLDLIRVMILSQTLNGILLPFLLLYMIRLINDRSVMGKHVNGPVFNTIAWGVTLTAIGLTVLLIALTVLGIG